MTVTISIVQLALSAAARSKQCGLLVGYRDGSKLIMLSAAYCGLGELASTRDALAGLLPPPLAVLGAFVSTQEDVAAAQETLGLGSVVGVPAVDGMECYSDGGRSSQPAAVIPTTSSNTRMLADVLAGSMLPLRCSMDLVLQVPEPAGAAAGAAGAGGGAPSRQALAAAFEELKQQACGPGTVYLAEGAGGSHGQPGRLVAPGNDSLAATGASWDRPLQLRPFCSAGSSAAECAGPSMEFVPDKCMLCCAELHVDVLCYAPKAMAAQQAVQEVVRPAVVAQLAVMQKELEGRGGLSPQRALHFLPPGLGHHITLVYPLPTPSIEAEEEPLQGARAALHQLLGLPTNRPLLRVANALDFSPAAAAAAAAAGGKGPEGGAAGGVGGKPRLPDVHAALAPSGVGGSVHLVQGTYDYYHYMQDKFDDSGWGCAYRSLQTICSWFAKQLYTSRPVPSHREIQQTLVSIGDKQQGFIGSKQWIGAIELGYVLDTLLGVPCKVLTVSSGADMPSKAREIAHHFDTQGTPIMIGGGVLAYTLLGIDFNERTGDCAFLILDPHYTGPEDLKKIHSGQWVAWKKLGDKAAAGGELFVKDAFYNLLCPQRPVAI